jgi:excisionase family DNA binding protein
MGNVVSALTAQSEQIKVSEMTISQLKVVMLGLLNEHSESGGKANNEGDYIYGLDGLAEFLGCSKNTAAKLKNSGSVEFFQVGKKFLFSKKEVLTKIQKFK